MQGAPKQAGERYDHGAGCQQAFVKLLILKEDGVDLGTESEFRLHTVFTSGGKYRVRAFQAILMEVHSTAPGQADERMMKLERGELCDPELAIKSYWKLFRDMIYDKIARIEAGQKQIDMPPDSDGNVMTIDVESSHDVEYEIFFTKKRFIDAHTGGLDSPQGAEFDDQNRELFVKHLRDITPDASYIPTLIRMYAQNGVPRYDDFTPDWLEVLFEYDNARKAGIFTQEELNLAKYTHPLQFLKTLEQADDRQAMKQAAAKMKPKAAPKKTIN